MVWQALNKNGGSKNGGRTFDNIGYTLQEL